ncbi:hypothetical protein PHJA_002109600 [Phtheirospermum japonicum]|uniref:Uncharacterized protein n=1 Tax=Phtheirospermum japonicum TaxID=374723 RepID=A0A830CX82_9LAMI|nr:hypothetical protein PHJA_002109600 [Phtheirospermum japonicum]
MFFSARWKTLSAGISPQGGPSNGEHNGIVVGDGGPEIAVVMLGWLGAKPKHLRRYVELYNDKGIHAVTFCGLGDGCAGHLIWGKSWRRGFRGCRMSWRYGAILDNLKDRQDLLGKIKGCIVDSGGDPNIDPKKNQWEEFLVAKFQSGLDSTFWPVRDNLLSSEAIPALSNALSRVLRVATGCPESNPSTPSENSAMAICSHWSSRGRCGGRGREVDSSKGSLSCVHCGRSNHASEKCWAKFGKPEWANAISDDRGTPPLVFDMISVSRAEYAKLLDKSSATAAASSSGEIVWAAGFTTALLKKSSSATYPLTETGQEVDKDRFWALEESALLSSALSL